MKQEINSHECFDLSEKCTVISALLKNESDNSHFKSYHNYINLIFFRVIQSLNFEISTAYSRKLLLSMREAVFTVSPNRQYRGMVVPTTPATTGPTTFLKVRMDFV